MHFAYQLPWWGLVLIVAAGIVAGYASYLRRRGLAGWQKHVLAGLRSAALVVLVLILFRPVIAATSHGSRGTVVPILVDESSSMRIADADGRRRIDAAADAVKKNLWSQLGRDFRTEVFAFGETVSPSDLEHLSSPADRTTNIAAAVKGIHDRYQRQALGGIVLISDGGDTGGERAASAAAEGRVPVFTLGVGSSGPDREVQSVTVDDRWLAGSAVDIDSVVLSRDLGRDNFDVTLTANGNAIDTKHVTVASDAPQHVHFTVTPETGDGGTDPTTVYSVTVPVDSHESVSENNTASAVLMPAQRKRRVLFVQGAPGFEHSFMRRAWSSDPAVDVDSVVRKGKDDQGREAFFVQADPSRAPSLVSGFPTTRAGLFIYDAIVFADVEWDFFTRDQLSMTADFVRERGGGVLVLGARSFVSPGLSGAGLDQALPLELVTSRPSVAKTSGVVDEHVERQGGSADNKVRLTAEGRENGMMRVAATVDDNDREWTSLPPLAAVNILGGPKPGATVLATANVSGTPRPVVATERFGRGRSMEFAGEGSWRWKMLMPATDRTHELFWRQVVRWLSQETPEPVSILPLQDAQPGNNRKVEVLAADADFHPAPGAVVTLRASSPGGLVQSATATLSDARTGRYSASINFPQPGLYKIEAEARQGKQMLGTATRSVFAGAIDPEFADPRLNEAVLQRIAAASGGRYLPLAQAASVPAMLRHAADDRATTPEPYDLWHNPAVFALVVSLLGAEWVLRRRWGLV